MAIQQPGAVQSVPKKKKKPFLSRVKKGFVTSIYVTYVWEWFLNLAGRLVQMVLFFTIMYNIVQSYPGFVSPGAWIDQLAFMLQNGALDIGSFGLPRLADQALKDGNAEGAEKAMQTSKALFWIMISNLVWGGIEHVIGSGMPDGVKTFVALVFLVIRAYYAISYTKVVHALAKAEPDEEEPDPAPSPVAPSIDYTALVDLLKPHLEEIKASLAVDLKPVVSDLDYLALALAVAPHIEARSTTQVALSPDMSPVDLKPVALASSQVALSPVAPKEPVPAPPTQVQPSVAQVPLVGGSELEKSSRAGSGSIKEPLKAGPVATKSSNEERDRKLEIAYAAMVAEGKAISGRTLAATAKCARPAATEWLRLLLQVAPSGSESSSGPEATGSGTSGPGSHVSGSESSGLEAGTSGADEVDLKPRSRVRNTDELMALDLEVSNA